MQFSFLLDCLVLRSILKLICCSFSLKPELCCADASGLFQTGDVSLVSMRNSIEIAKSRQAEVALLCEQAMAAAGL